MATQKASLSASLPTSGSFVGPLTTTTTIAKRGGRRRSASVEGAGGTGGGGGVGGGGSDTSNSVEKRNPQREAKSVTFYKNGDRYFKGIKIQLTPQRYITFSHLLSDLTKWISLPYGVRRLYSHGEGRLIDAFDQMFDGEVYVCASFEKFKPLQYGHGLGDPVFKGGHIRGRGSYGPSSHRTGPSLQSGLSPQVSRKAIGAHLSQPAQAIGASSSSSPSHRHRPAHSSVPAAPLRREDPPPPSHANATPRRGGDAKHLTPHRHGGGGRSHANGAPDPSAAKGQATDKSKDADKPKVIIVVRLGKRPRKSIKFTLPKRIRSIDQLLVDITHSFDSRFRNSRIQKLFSIDGDEIGKVDDLLEANEAAVFVGVGDHESVSSTDFLSIRRELFGKMKSVSKYSKIRSQIGRPTSDHPLPPPASSTASSETKTSQPPTSPRLVAKASSRTTTTTTAARDDDEEDDERDLVESEKHTGKDSGIEDEDTPRDSEGGSKTSLVERRDEEETSTSSTNFQKGLRVEKIRLEAQSRNRKSTSAAAEGATSPAAASKATSSENKRHSDENKRTTDETKKSEKKKLPPLKVTTGDGDFKSRLMKEKEKEKEKMERNREEIERREEQREKLWSKRKEEMFRRVRSSNARSANSPARATSSGSGASAASAAKRRRRRSDSSASVPRVPPTKRAPLVHHRSVEEIPGEESRRDFDELRPIDEVRSGTVGARSGKEEVRSGHERGRKERSGEGRDTLTVVDVTLLETGNDVRDDVTDDVNVDVEYEVEDDFEQIVVDEDGEDEPPAAASTIVAGAAAPAAAAAAAVADVDFEIFEVDDDEFEAAMESKAAPAEARAAPSKGRPAPDADRDRLAGRGKGGPSVSSGIICDIQSVRVVHDRYSLGKQIGDGNFAVVRTCRARYGATVGVTGAEFAIKVIDKSRLNGKEEMVKSEVSIMRRCAHPNIVKLMEEMETKEHIYLVMELVKDGDLFDAITRHQRFDERPASRMVSDVASALRYLHSSRIVHRDLKPENLLVVRGESGSPSLKLADFGLAMVVDDPLFTVCGTPTYVAPEILNETGYGLPVDIWALGVITYILLCGFPPFRSPDRRQSELFEIIKAGEFEYLSPYWDSISSPVRDLIDSMLEMDPQRRFKASQVLNHKWILKHNLPAREP